MLIYLLTALVLIQLIRVNMTKRVEPGQIMNYLLPYWEKGDGEDKLLGIVQLIFILGISLLKALKTEHLGEGILVFIFTFISFIWFIKLLISLASWLGEYIHMVTANIIFTLLVPLLILFNIQQLQGSLEIKVCLIALLMSIGIVYMELVDMILDKQIVRGKEVPFTRARRDLRLKSIFTWLLIILVNLYTLIVFVQFYWDSGSYHFIQASSLNEETAVDLFYYLIVTFTTVGLGDIQPHTEAAKLVTALVALTGMFFTGIFVSVILSMDKKAE